MDYKALSADELVQEVNKLTVQGMTLTAMEKMWGLRAKYISDKIKTKYRIDKTLKQYILREDTTVVTRSDTVTIEDKSIEKEVVTTEVTEVVTQHETQQQQVFKGDELEIIYKLIEEYRVKQKLQEYDAEAEDKEELTNRNIRVYTKQYNRFADWCKKNNVTQAEALYKAINLLMNM